MRRFVPSPTLPRFTKHPAVSRTNLTVHSDIETTRLRLVLICELRSKNKLCFKNLCPYGILRYSTPLLVIAVVEAEPIVNVPSHLRKLLADIVQVLLAKIDVPQVEIEEMAESIYEKGVPEMFNIENYSVQETRREARAEGRDEGIDEGIDLLAGLLKSGMSLEAALIKAKESISSDRSKS